MQTMVRSLLLITLPFYGYAGNFSCVKVEPAACAYSANSNCGSFAMNSASDIDAWLTADSGQPCSVIGGSLTIQHWNINAADLAKMMPLVAVCGSVTIQQLATGTLEGLNNLSYIGGSFFLAQNTAPWSSGGEVSDVSALSKLIYVGGAMTVTENYYLTEGSIAAAFSNLQVAGAVNIEFYGSPPTVAGAVATMTGSVNECTASTSSTMSTWTESPQTSSSTQSPSLTSQSQNLTVEFSCAKAEPEACAYSASSNCSSFAMNSASDIDAWLTADNGQPCSVIGGSLTIQHWNINAADLAKMMPLVAVCGSVTIQQLATGTLEGLNNLSYIGGSFFLAQNAAPWSSGGEVSDVSALSKLIYVGGAMTVTENYYLTEGSIAAAFSNLQVAGAVNIEFYGSPPTVAGAVATKTGSVNECTASTSSTTSTVILEGSVSITIENTTVAFNQEFKTAMSNAIAAVAKVPAEQVTVTINPNARRLRSIFGRRIAASLRIDYEIQMTSHASPSIIASNLNTATPSAVTSSFTKALADADMRETVGVISITSSITSVIQSTTTPSEETEYSSAATMNPQSFITTLVVFLIFLLSSF